MDPVVKIFGSVAQAASLLGRPYTTVQSWNARGSIPTRHWADVIAAAAKIGKTITVHDLSAVPDQVTPQEGEGCEDVGSRA